jgi:hypothetical protein
MDENKVEIIEETDSEILESFEKNSPYQKSPKNKKNSSGKLLIVFVVIAVVLAGILCLLIFMPKGDNESELNGTASVSSKLDKDNVWQAEVEKEGGNVKVNGSGTLMELVPADIKQIEVKNEKSNYKITAETPTVTLDETDPETGEKKEGTDSTVYTLVGYEDFELQPGVADEIAGKCASLAFTSVSSADAGSNLSDFGMDKPRGTITVTYTDKTKAVIIVGKDAPQNLGTYVMFGSGKAVFLCDKEDIENLLYGINDLISLTINNAAASTEDSELKSLTLSGSAFPESVTLEPNNYTECIPESYVISSPAAGFADETVSSNITGGLRGLYAESVESVNPSQSTLKKLGLSPAYAKAEAEYPDVDISLIASKPDSSGSCYLMEDGGKVVYKLKKESVSWVSASLDSLKTGNVLDPALSALTGMSVRVGSKTYDFEIKTTETKTTDDEGEESTTTETVTSYNGKELEQGNFEIFFRNASLLTLRSKNAKQPGGSPELTITYTYGDKRGADTVEFYKSGSDYVAVVNGTARGTVNSTHITKLKTQASDVAKGTVVKTFW